MEIRYVEQRDGGRIRITGTCIRWDSRTNGAFKRAVQRPSRRNGPSPLLTLEDIYADITFYLAHEQEIPCQIWRNRLKQNGLPRRTVLNAAARFSSDAHF